jgi:Fibronectin type III domain
MKTATLPRVGRDPRTARWFGLLAMAATLLGAVSLQAQFSQTETTVTTLGGGPQYYNPGSSYGYSNSINGTLESQFHTPSGIAVDNGLDLLYVADRDNNAVRYLDLVSGQTYTLAPYPPYIPTNLISQPVGVAVDAVGNVYVLNRGNGANGSVVEIDYYGDYITNVTGLADARGIALDTLGDIYVSTSNTVFKITPAGVSNVVATITAPGANLQGIVMKRSGANAGWLAVCDAGRDGIYLINPTNGVVTTNAGFNGVGDGTGLNNRGIANAQAQFFQPSGLAEAGDGSLIVADSGNNRVKLVGAYGYVTNLYGVSSNDWWSGTTAGGGTAWPGWSDGNVWQPDNATGNVQARMPFGVAIGSDGTLYTTEDYYHIIRKVTGANIQQPPPFPPPAPLNPNATAGYGQVHLTWSASPGATNYNVKRATTSGSETTIGSTTGTSYTDTNLLDGTTYYYAVSGLNTGGEGENSAEVSATPLFSPAPTNLVVTTTNFGLISLSWSPSAGATSYNAKRSTSSGKEITIASATGTTFNDTSVSNATMYYYVVSAVNPGGESPLNSPEVSAVAPVPPPPAPQIGWFDYEGITPPVTVFHSVSGAAFTSYNDSPPWLAVVPTVAGISTYYTTDGSTPSPTNSNSSQPPVYLNGVPYSVPGLPVVGPDVVIKAVNVGPGGDSAVVTAEFIYQTGIPNLTGNNAAQFTVNDTTIGAQFLYTTDGSDPRTNMNATLIGPVASTNGITLSLPFPPNTNSMLFQIAAFKAHYLTSSVASVVFSTSNYVPNTISFGFASGPGSCQFVASPGQSFTVPIGVTLVPNAPPIYGLQFNLTLTNLTSHVVDPTTIGFGSLLGKPDVLPDGYYQIIPPWMFVSDSQPNNDPGALQYQGNWYQNLVFSDTNNEDLLGIGWLEVYGRTNLYNTLNQNLLTYPILRGNDPYPSSSQIVGYYTFQIPTAAAAGDVYQIRIGRPSGTTFPGLSVNPYGLPVSFAAPVNTNLLGPGSVNALKNVTIGSIPYLVGDVYPANWFNAGDFGSSNLLNVDVIRVFDFAAYSIAAPPPASDLFDALDSCGNIGVYDGATGYYTNAATYPYEFAYTTTNTIYTYTNNVLISTVSNISTNTQSIYIDITSISAVSTDTAIYYTSTNTETFTTNHTAFYSFANPYVPNLFNGSDTNINQIAFGDGKLDVCDVYVTFRRSLDTNSLVWFQRFWNNGERVATASFAPGIESAFQPSSSGGKVQPAYSSGSSPVSITNAPAVQFTAGDDLASAGQTIQIPVTASVFGQYPLKVALLNLTVVPLDGSPALTSPVSFTPGAALGAPTSGFTTSDGNGNYAAAWLDSTIAGISSNAVVGTLNVPIPANANSLSAYAVHFDSASGSPNGLGSFPVHTFTGLITLSSRTNSTYNDGIPDSWRLRWFGTVNNLLSVSNACPSGDGVNNWQKYIAGVDPTVAGDFPSLNPKTPPSSGAAMSIYWPTVNGKQYAILSSPTLFPGQWTTNSIVTGNGANLEFDDHSGGPVKFYRVLILP